MGTFQHVRVTSDISSIESPGLACPIYPPESVFALLTCLSENDTLYRILIDENPFDMLVSDLKENVWELRYKRGGYEKKDWTDIQSAKCS